jgi:hypothetical protein
MTAEWYGAPRRCPNCTAKINMGDSTKIVEIKRGDKWFSDVAHATCPKDKGR